MIEKLVLPEVRELIQAEDFATLGEVLNDWLPPDLVGVIEELDDAEKIQVFRALEGSLASETFGYLGLTTQERLLDGLSAEEGAGLVGGMAPDDRTALLAELPGDRAGRLLALLSPEDRAVAQSLLQYDKDSIGRLMTPDYVSVRKDWTVRRVLDHVRTHGRDSETLNVLYVVDAKNTLIDDVRIREILLAPLTSNVRDVMDDQFVALKVTDDKRSAVGVFRKYDRSALPVVDAAGTLVGIVTIDDVLDVAERQATEELQRFGGLEALEDSYTGTPTLTLVRKRAYWLVVLFVGEMLTATAMGFYERQIEKAVVLALFVPLIISSGGNSGSQAATLIIRAMALGEVRLRDWWSVMRRELLSGLLLGTLLGTIGFLRIGVWSAFSGIYGPHWALVGLTVAFSLLGIVSWGTFAGSMLPFVLKRVGLDPATSSAPFVATLVDVTGLVIYFTVAVVILHGTLL